MESSENLKVSGIKEGEYRPLVRQLSENEFWEKCMWAMILSMCCLMSRVFDIPAFWPILLM